MTRILLLLYAMLYRISLAVECNPGTTSSSLQPTWHCTGQYSDLTYRDCEGWYYNTTGCFFLEHFAQYRACATICNDVIVHTIAEMKCRSYCPGKPLLLNWAVAHWILWIQTILKESTMSWWLGLLGWGCVVLWFGLIGFRKDCLPKVTEHSGFILLSTWEYQMSDSGLGFWGWGQCG